MIAPDNEFKLPVVAGRRITCSLADFEQACLVCLMTEQEKILPDNALINTLCEGVRLAREIVDKKVKG